MNKRICERIKKARTALGLSQAELAERVKVTRQTITNYETGVREPGLYMLENLATALNVTLGYLVGGTDDPRPSPPARYTDRDGADWVEADADAIAHLQRRHARVSVNGLDNHYVSAGISAETPPRRRPTSTGRRYDDHAVQADGVILASPEYQAKKYREEQERKRLERDSGHITQEELDLIKLFRSADAKGQEMIKNIAEMVNERTSAKEEKPKGEE